jgi:hypothetical protein
MIESQNIPTVLMGADGPETLAGRLVVEWLPCVQCGYDVRGVQAEGRCPECGLPVPLSLAGSIDPEAHRLPPMVSPAAVGRGLVLAALGLALIVTLSFVLAAAFLPLIWNPEVLAGHARMRLAPRGLVFAISLTTGNVAMVCAAMGLLAWWSIRPKSTTAANMRRTRSLRMLLGGFFLLSIPVASLSLFSGGLVIESYALVRVVAVLGAPLLPIPGTILALAGLRELLGEVGVRSRVFRSSGVRRQRVRPLIASLSFMGICWVAMVVSERLGAEELTVVFLTLGLTTLFIALVGHWYLVINTFWIRRALKEPPPRLADLLSPRSANLAGSVGGGGGACHEPAAGSSGGGRRPGS